MVEVLDTFFFGEPIKDNNTLLCHAAHLIQGRIEVLNVHEHRISQNYVYLFLFKRERFYRGAMYYGAIYFFLSSLDCIVVYIGAKEVDLGLLFSNPHEVGAGIAPHF